MKYQVKSPDGVTHIIDGPDNATPDEIITQAQRLIPTRANTQFTEALKTQPATTFMQGLTTNAPTQGITAMAGRAALPTVGGMIGAGAGGGVASIPGAAAGGAAGEAIRQDLVSLAKPSEQRDLGDVTGRVALQGAAEGLSQGVGLGVGKILSRPGMIKAGAQALSIGNATPEKYGEAALRGGASTLARAKQLAGGLAEKSYQAFEKYTGLKGLREFLTQGAKYADGKIVSAGEEGGKDLAQAGSTMVRDVALRIANGEKVDPQTLYVAGQMANHLRTTNPFAPEAEKLMSGSMSKWKTIIDEELQTVYPEYKSLRTDRFLSGLGERFKSIVPLKKDMSANMLRGYGAMEAGLGGIGALLGSREGHPASGAAIAMGLGTPLIASPRVAGLAIQGASRLSQSGIPSAITKWLGSVSADKLPAIMALIRQRQQQDQP